MLQRELAEALDISPAMVSKLAKRGMPTDSLERAQRWRKRHLEPGRVKAFKAPTGRATQQTPPPQPSGHAVTLAGHSPMGQPCNWLDMAAPQTVTAWTVEAVAAACAHLLQNAPSPDDAAYPLAFLRDLLRRTDPHEVRFRLPLCVWLHLVEGWVHPEAIQLLKQNPGGELLDAATLGRLVNPERPFPPLELIDAAADVEGISVIGWPAEQDTETD